VTSVPSAKSWLQLEPQSIPAGLEETEPLPAPARVTAKVCVTGSKPAVTERAALIVTVHVLELPEQSPDQPLKTDPGAAVAVSVTTAPWTKLALHVAPQLMPAGDESTVPEPEPDFVTVSVRAGLKAASTLLAELIVTVQVVDEPEQSPVQPVKIEPAEVVAVRVTTVFSEKLALHVAPQVIPAGEEVTVPDPEPDFVTVSVCGVPKIAVTSRAALIVTLHVVDEPEQSPDQPTKLDPPPPAAAVSVTTVPSV
jgi:hypothetical protein